MSMQVTAHLLIFLHKGGHLLLDALDKKVAWYPDHGAPHSNETAHEI